MIRFLAQIVLWISGLFAGLFIAADDNSYPIYQLGISLVLLMLGAIIIWVVSTHRKQ